MATAVVAMVTKFYQNYWKLKISIVHVQKLFTELKFIDFQANCNTKVKDNLFCNEMQKYHSTICFESSSFKLVLRHRKTHVTHFSLRFEI